MEDIALDAEPEDEVKLLSVGARLLRDFDLIIVERLWLDRALELLPSDWLLLAILKGSKTAKAVGSFSFEVFFVDALLEDDFISDSFRDDVFLESCVEASLACNSLRSS
jgi:hypothetical protein